MGTTDLGVTIPPGVLTASVRQEVERAVATNVPEGKQGALVTVVNADGVHLGVTANLDRKGNWKLDAAATKAWGGKVTGQVLLVGSW
jgi:hypothetical protein